jgi:hypothetical protein
MIRVIRAARARGVRGIVWVNLKAVRADYGRINAIIAQTARQRPNVHVANWNAYSRGRTSWFQPWDDEKIHLTSAGAVGLVRLVRRHIPLAAEGSTAAAAQASADPAEEPEPEESAATAETETTDAELTASSPPVGPNLGGPDGGSTGLSGFLPFAGGAALMLFLILVTVKRRRVA